MEVLYKAPQTLIKLNSKYCPGCGHGVVHKIISEVIDELGYRERSILINPVGCSIWADLYFDCDSVQPPHGRGPAAATGIKRMLPDELVFTYQGDGDIAAIGTAEIIHAAARGEKFTTIFVNNAIYGMTSGQMAPTTLIGQESATSPGGRDPELGQGSPLRMCEMLATLDGTRYLARGSVHNAANIRKTKQYIKKAFEAQLRGEGFTLIEILGQCPTNWRMSPQDSVDWIESAMVPVFPLGEIKNSLGAADKKLAVAV